MFIKVANSSMVKGNRWRNVSAGVTETGERKGNVVGQGPDFLRSAP